MGVADGKSVFLACNSGASVMNWFTRLWSPARPTHPAPVHQVEAASTAAVSEPSSAPDTDMSAEASHPFVPWLAGTVERTTQTITPNEQHALDVLQGVLALPEIPDMLLPRAAEVVPQLIALLRETQLPLQAIAQRVGKDPLLVAEVLRLASSPYYRAQGDVTDLEQGIRLIGSVGLQSAIARVVLKPIYRSAAGASGSLHANAIARLWKHSEALAERAAALADSAGLDAFDGYLLGMLHDTGWKVALASLDRAKYTLAAQPSAAFVTELTEQAHRLFGLAAQRWTITPGFTAFAADARQNGLANGKHPMAALLQQALYLCTLPGGR